MLVIPSEYFFYWNLNHCGNLIGLDSDVWGSQAYWSCLYTCFIQIPWENLGRQSSNCLQRNVMCLFHTNCGWRGSCTLRLYIHCHFCFLPIKAFPFPSLFGWLEFIGLGFFLIAFHFHILSIYSNEKRSNISSTDGYASPFHVAKIDHEQK